MAGIFRGPFPAKTGLGCRLCPGPHGRPQNRRPQLSVGLARRAWAPSPNLQPNQAVRAGAGTGGLKRRPEKQWLQQVPGARRGHADPPLSAVRTAAGGQRPGDTGAGPWSGSPAGARPSCTVFLYSCTLSWKLGSSRASAMNSSGSQVTMASLQEEGIRGACGPRQTPCPSSSIPGDRLQKMLSNLSDWGLGRLRSPARQTFSQLRASHSSGSSEPLSSKQDGAALALLTFGGVDRRDGAGTLRSPLTSARYIH